MKRVWLLLLFPFRLLAQNSDWKELQGMIDEAVKSNGTVYIKRNYTIDQPLVAAKWNGKSYEQFSIRILGDATMWDVNSRSVIKATFRDAPLLSIQSGDGVLIKGVNLRGLFTTPSITTETLYAMALDEFADPSCRDSRYSPYAAIAIDPFNGTIPSDGGYPNLSMRYAKSGVLMGSKGVIVEDCTLHGFTVGVVVSPGGEGPAAEQLTFRNIRIGTCKVGFAGGLASERNIRVINIGAWGTTHTLFAFNWYGRREAGSWEVDGINVAGTVVQLVNRKSSPGSSFRMKYVFAESLGKIGDWSAASTEELENASINFRYVSQTNGFPSYALKGDGIAIKHSTLRYYGTAHPVFFIGEQQHQEVSYDMNRAYLINKQHKSSPRKPVQIGPIDGKQRKTELRLTAEKGAAIAFYDAKGNWVGYGLVEAANAGSVTIAWLSHSIVGGQNYECEVVD